MDGGLVGYIMLQLDSGILHSHEKESIPMNWVEELQGLLLNVKIKEQNGVNGDTIICVKNCVCVNQNTCFCIYVRKHWRNAQKWLLLGSRGQDSIGQEWGGTKAFQYTALV